MVDMDTQGNSAEQAESTPLESKPYRSSTTILSDLRDHIALARKSLSEDQYHKHTFHVVTLFEELDSRLIGGYGIFPEQWELDETPK